MGKTAVTTDRVARPVGPFSAAIRGRDGRLYLSGQVAQDPATGKLIDGDVARQTEQTLTNARSVLEAAGLGFDDVVRVGVFLTDMGDFLAMNTVYARHFTPPFPARTTVAVAALPLGARVEIEMVAEAAG